MDATNGTGRRPGRRFAPGNNFGPGNPPRGDGGETGGRHPGGCHPKGYRRDHPRPGASGKGGDMAAIRELVERAIGKPTDADLAERRDAPHAITTFPEWRYAWATHCMVLFSANNPAGIAGPLKKSANLLCYEFNL